jgi:DNA-binding phage protein
MFCTNESDGDAAFIAKVSGDSDRGDGETKIASEVGLSRESLYKALYSFMMGAQVLTRS